jgi:hypothetical protein
MVAEYQACHLLYVFFVLYYQALLTPCCGRGVSAVCKKVSCPDSMAREAGGGVILHIILLFYLHQHQKRLLYHR